MARKDNNSEQPEPASEPEQAEPATPKVKRCFIIAPIGDDNSEVRQRSDNVMDFIITPALKECGYLTPPDRADRMPGAGQITSQIIKAIIDAELVVADLTGHNPNVFYELAIRHAVRKAIVQIMQDGERLPFDVSNQRTIFFDYRNLRSADKAKQAIVGQIKHSEKNPGDVDTPVTSALNIGSLEASNNPLERTVGEILVAVQGLQRVVGMSTSNALVQAESQLRVSDEVPLVIQHPLYVGMAIHDFVLKNSGMDVRGRQLDDALNTLLRMFFKANDTWLFSKKNLQNAYDNILLLLNDEGENYVKDILGSLGGGGA